MKGCTDAMETAPPLAMALLFLLVVQLCLKLFVQLSMDEWMSLIAVFFIAVALLISHRVHMLSGR